MSGGIFDMNISKKRPGTYLNFKSKKGQKVKGSSRGIAIVPLIDLGWGVNGTMLKISNASPDAYAVQLGHSVYDADNNMLLIREILKNAVTCYAYIINNGTAASVEAGGMTITATYAGTRGNDISVACVANATEGSKFDVKVYLDTNIVEQYEKVGTIAELISASSGAYVKFSAVETSAALQAFAVAKLTGGTNTKSANSDVSAFLDACEGVKFNTMCFPVTESSLQAAATSKIKYLRDNVGKYVQAVMPDCSANYEGIINVTNSVTIDGVDLTNAQACAWVTGITAAAEKTESNTYAEYSEATAVVGVKTNEQAELAIDNGEFFFSMSEEGKVIVEYDINSLHTFTADRTEDYRKNRVMRVYDSFAEDIKMTFPPNKYSNDETGWLVMEGLGRALLNTYVNDGAISDVSAEEDFYVDQERSIGDQTYFNVGLKAVDSAEKLYFSVSTR